MEFGARSDTDPTSTAQISPYVAEIYPGEFTLPSFQVQAVQPERTFLEKAMLLYEHATRENHTPKKEKLSRHYYDLWKMIEAGIGKKALENRGLFKRVAEHRAIYFKVSRVDYDYLKSGNIIITPNPDHLSYWESDYQTMKEEMISGKAPSFDSMMAAIKEFQENWESS